MPEAPKNQPNQPGKEQRPPQPQQPPQQQPRDQQTDPALEAFGRAFNGLVKQIGSAWVPQEVHGRTEDARRALQDVAGDPQKQFEIYQTWQRGVAEAVTADQVQERLRTAYQGYLRELQDAWRRVDPASLGPWQLAAIAHSQRVAAHWAYCASWAALSAPRSGT
jgi:hypothetical protein